MKKRILSLILMAVLIMTMMPASIASAATEVKGMPVIESFEFNDNVSVIENTNGSWQKETNPLTGDTREWFKYDVENKFFGITFENGDSIYSGYDEESTGNGFYYNGRFYEIVYDIEQSFGKQLGVGTHEITASIKGTSISSTFKYYIEESPITDINIDSLEVIENCDGKKTESGRFVYNLASICNEFFVVTKAGKIESDPDSGTIEYEDMLYRLEIETDQSETNMWTLGNTYIATLRIMGFSKVVPVKVVSSTIESISFKNMSAILGTGGEYITYDPATGKKGEPYFSYYTQNYDYTVKMKDGTTITHSKNDNRTGFVHNGRYYHVDYDNGLCYDNQWGEPGNYTVKAYAPGYEGSFIFTVLPSPVTKVEIGEISVIENTFLDTEYVYDENANQTGSYDKYDLYKICKDYKVTLNDGTIIKGGESYNLKYYYPVFWDNQTETNRWKAGNTYEATMEIMGVKTPFKIKVISGNNFKISMSSTEYKMPAGVYCEEDYWSSDNRLTYTFDKVISNYTITTPDGSVISSDPNDKHSVTYKGMTYYPEFVTDEVIYTPWKAGETHNVTMKILGNEIDFKVTVVEGPVVSIDFGELKIEENRGGDDMGAYYHYDLQKICKNYTVTMNDGTKIQSTSFGDIIYNDKCYELIIHDNQGENNAWSAGYNTFDVEIMGTRFPVQVTIEHKHNWTYSIVNGETCNDSRIKKYYCTKNGCKETKEEVLPATGHVYDGESDRCIYCNQLPNADMDDTLDKIPEQEENPIPETPSIPTPKPEEDDEEHVCKHKKSITKATTKKSGKVIEVCSCGNVKYKITIPRIKTVKLSTATYTYNGKIKTPRIIVSDINGNVLRKGKDYTVTIPKGKKYVGTYTYSIKFKGNYSGTKKLTLTIKPTKPIIKKPKTVKKAVTVKWQKVKKQTTGYQVMLATNKKFTKNTKKVFVKGASKTSVRISKLKEKKNYYVKVRSYKSVKVRGKNVKVYSEWSKIRTCKTK